MTDTRKSACTLAADTAQQLAFNLLGSSGTASHASRTACAVRAARLWPLLCRYMVEVERLSPNTTGVGSEDDAHIAAGARLLRPNSEAA